MPSTLPDPGISWTWRGRKSCWLAEAGYPNGFDTTLRVSDQPFLNIAIAVQSTLMQAG